MAASHYQQETAAMALFATQIEELTESKGSLHWLMWLLDRDHQLLKRKDFRGYANVWEWTLHQMWANIVVMYLLLKRRELVPINTINTITGDSILTNIRSQELQPEVLRMLLMSGEDLDYVNKKTGDTFLHAMAKYHRNTNEKPYLLKVFTGKIQESIVEGDINFPDPDYKNKEGMTALQLTLETGNLSLANALVEFLGASWKGLPNGRFSSNKTVLDLLKKWDEAYGLCSNNFLSEVGDVGCGVCCEALNVPQEIYSMECCGRLIHVECFRIHLSRSTKPQCIFCNMLVVEEVRQNVPSTIYKKKWQQHITKETIAAAAMARARTLQKKFEVVKEAAKKEKKEPPIVLREGPSQPTTTFRPSTASSRKRRRSSTGDDVQPSNRRVCLELDDDEDFVPETRFRLPRRRRSAAVRGTRQSRATSSRIVEDVVRSVVETIIPFNMY